MVNNGKCVRLVFKICKKDDKLILRCEKNNMEQEERRLDYMEYKIPPGTEAVEKFHPNEICVRCGE